MDTPTPVVIVGAGPVGLTLALALARLDIPSTVLTAGTQRCDGSRAIALHRSALATWRPLGITPDILARAITWRSRRTYYRLRELHTLTLPPPDAEGLPVWCNFGQSDLEDLLLAQVKACADLIDLRWGHEVTGIEPIRTDANDASVMAIVRPDPCRLPAYFPARYIVACDGARSSIRRLMHLDFPGRTFADQFLIADIRADVDWPAEPRFFFDHPAHRGSTLLIHPQPDRVWRVDWQLGRNVDPAAVPILARAKLDQLLGGTAYQVLWSSVYRFHQRLMPSLQHGRVFFAGDAAHLVAPFGARGLNSGIADVTCLAPRLAYALNGTMAPDVLRSYTTQRMPALQRDQREVSATMRFMAPQSAIQHFARRSVLTLANHYSFARPWVNSGRMYQPT